jgi:hypothetical protein
MLGKLDGVSTDFDRKVSIINTKKGGKIVFYSGYKKFQINGDVKNQ